jgi:hypothetical protein
MFAALNGGAILAQLLVTDVGTRAGGTAGMGFFAAQPPMRTLRRTAHTPTGSFDAIPERNDRLMPGIIALLVIFAPVGQTTADGMMS